MHRITWASQIASVCDMSFSHGAQRAFLKLCGDSHAAVSPCGSKLETPQPQQHWPLSSESVVSQSVYVYFDHFSKRASNSSLYRPILFSVFFTIRLTIPSNLSSLRYLKDSFCHVNHGCV